MFATNITSVAQSDKCQKKQEAELDKYFLFVYYPPSVSVTYWHIFFRFLQKAQSNMVIGPDLE